MSDFRTGRASQRGSGRSNYRRQPPRQQQQQQQYGPRKRPVWLLVIADILCLGIALNIFALSNGLFQPTEQATSLPIHTKTPPAFTPIPTHTHTPTPTPSASKAAPTGSDAPTESPTAEPTATPDTSGLFGPQFADKFLVAGSSPVITDSTYQSHDLNITITKTEQSGYQYCVADIYVRDIQNFKTFLNKDKFGGSIDSTLNQAIARNAILAVNGDNSGNRANSNGYEVHNSTVYRQLPWQDVLVLYNDGTMKSFGKADFVNEFKAIKAGTAGNGGAGQVWTFGPMLLDTNSQPLAKFAPESITGGGNERTAIGYYEPGHYCFVVVGSTDKSKRDGPGLAELSQFMAALGCKVAYNMDGGQSSEMVFNGKFVNVPYQGGRSINDIVAIGEADQMK